MRGLLAYSLLMVLGLSAQVRAESLLESAMYGFTKPYESLNRILLGNEDCTGDIEAYLASNRRALDTAFQAAASGDCALPDGYSDFSGLLDLGRSLSARGLCLDDPRDILATMRLGGCIRSRSSGEALSVGYGIERSALQAYATWVERTDSPARLAEALARFQQVESQRPAFHEAVASELNEAKRKVAEVCRTPAAGRNSGEEFLLLSRMRSSEREKVLQEFSRVLQTYAALADEAWRTADLNEVRAFRIALRNHRRSYRQGVRRVVAPPPDSLARALGASLFPDLEPLVQEALWTDAFAQSMPALTRLKLHVLEHGAFPEEGEVETATSDPFGGTLIYIPGNDQVRLYSRGPDRRDGGGRTNLETLKNAMGTDIIFTLTRPTEAPPDPVVPPTRLPGEGESVE